MILPRLLLFRTGLGYGSVSLPINRAFRTFSIFMLSGLHLYHSTEIPVK